MNHKREQMQSLRDLKTLLTEMESEHVERCQSPDSKEKIAKAICAFSNDIADSKKAGYILIGVKDNGDCAGLSVTDKMQLNISSLRNSGLLQPFPIISVQKHIVNQCQILVVKVQPIKHPPMRYKGSCWIRTGPSTRQTTAEDERLLVEKRQATNLPEDMKGVFNSDIDKDLNRDYFKSQYLPSAVSSEVLEENQRDIKEQMRSLRLLDHQFKPTGTAILIMGVNPRNWFPGAYIQFIRFEGKTLTDPVKNQIEVSGTLPDQLRRVEEIFKANISTSLELGKDRHIQSPDYPLVALSQLIRNAVIHRNYKSHTPVRVHWFEDRVEIQSPGGPYGELNIENFGKEGLTAYRNPTLAEALKNLGFVERFGFGLPKVRTALKQNGNPELMLKAELSLVLAVLKIKK